MLFRADSVSPRTFLVVVRIDSGGISGTETHMSILSATGPEILRRYFSTMCGIQSQREEPQKPHGHGFKAAMSMKFAGNIAEPLEREMETTRSSKGSRSALITSRWNSGNSSAKRTPRCASVASPGRTFPEPPPMSEAYEE